MTTATETRKVLRAGDLTFTSWNSGDLYEMKYRDILMNQLLSGPVEGSMNNLYLRLHHPEGIRAIPLLGIRSNSRLSFGADRAVWKGEAEGIQYEVVLRLDSRGIWFWDVRLEGQTTVEVDVVYGQDIGLAEPGAVRSNEAYMSQYIDHTVFQHERRGAVICSRQNQPQRGKFPYLQQGALTGATGFSTDGFQFFGLSYKETDHPEAQGAGERSISIRICVCGASNRSSGAEWASAGCLLRAGAGGSSGSDRDAGIPGVD